MSELEEKRRVSGDIYIHSEGAGKQAEVVGCKIQGQWKANLSRKYSLRMILTLKSTRSIWKSNAISLFTSQVPDCESLQQAVKLDCRWWMSHLSDALQSLHPLLPEESQEDKWLSFKFQEQGRGDRQCECHSLSSIDLSATDVKKSPGRKASHKSTD